MYSSPSFFFLLIMTQATEVCFSLWFSCRDNLWWGVNMTVTVPQGPFVAKSDELVVLASGSLWHRWTLAFLGLRDTTSFLPVSPVLKSLRGSSLPLPVTELWSAPSCTCNHLLYSFRTFFQSRLYCWIPHLCLWPRLLSSVHGWAPSRGCASHESSSVCREQSLSSLPPQTSRLRPLTTRQDLVQTRSVQVAQQSE